MTKETKEIFDELKNELAWLHAKWNIYKQLFQKSPERIHLLNECASGFFYVIQDVLFHEIIVGICKLMDPANSNKYKNLSLNQLQLKLRESESLDLMITLKNILDDLNSRLDSLSIWRNKKLAHLDLTTNLEKKIKSLPSIKIQQIEAILLLLTEYMINIERTCFDSETAYHKFMLQGDTEALVIWLKNGQRYEELVQKREIPPFDHRESKWYNA